jgi:hypothetical protein
MMVKPALAAIVPTPVTIKTVMSCRKAIRLVHGGVYFL